MAFKLTKDERLQQDAHVLALNQKGVALTLAHTTYTASQADLWETFQAAVRAYNEGLAALNNTFSDVLDDYNKEVQDAREFQEDIVSRLSDEFADKTEKWQDSAKGKAADHLRAAWDDTDLSDVEITLHEPIEIELVELEELPDVDLDTTISQLPQEPDDDDL